MNWAKRHQRFDLKLAEEISKKFSPQSLLDLGCGLGAYAKFFEEKGTKVNAVEGADLHEREIFRPIWKKDLTKPVKLKGSWEVILCLEVGEHIPPEKTETFVKNIPSGILILSWAVPGQGGVGHVNCLPNEEVLKLFPERTCDWEISKKLRKASSLRWFKNTIMVLYDNSFLRND